jgi:hypothetical protein
VDESMELDPNLKRCRSSSLDNMQQQSKAKK